ncbi:MAG: folate-binding protein YgfZ [Gammaproteobacteria bacterium]|nr:folate-binding protein YgfZ [Gammaproteobacteria bacterium]
MITTISETDFICKIDDMAIIEVSGEDSLTYLQGQLTNDINLVTQQSTQLSAYCTPKGRAICLFRIFKVSDKVYLVLAKDLLEAIYKRLKMFVMMSKVDILDVTEQYLHYGIVGDKAAQLVTDKGYQLPEAINESTNTHNTVIIKISQNQYEAFGLENDLKNLIELATSEYSSAEQSNWYQVNIINGIPGVSLASKELFIPQMLNLHFLNGINFKKGCYTGQEVIARLHYLGKMKRLMFAISFQSKNQCQIGDKIYSPISKSGQGAGQIVSIEAAKKNDDTYHYTALAVIELKVIDDDSIYLDQEFEIKADKLQLPYEQELLAREKEVNEKS